MEGATVMVLSRKGGEMTLKVLGTSGDILLNLNL